MNAVVFDEFLLAAIQLAKPNHSRITHSYLANLTIEIMRIDLLNLIQAEPSS